MRVLVIVVSVIGELERGVWPVGRHHEHRRRVLVEGHRKHVACGVGRGGAGWVGGGWVLVDLTYYGLR